MTHKLIKTDDYILVVDDSEIKVRDYYLRYNKSVLRCTKMELIFNDAINRHEVIIYTNNAGDPYERSRDSIKKIIAHLPLNAPILEGVDLLPPIDDVEQVTEKHFPDIYYDLSPYRNGLNRGFKQGYNKACEKYKYTDEDVKAFLDTFTEHAPLDYIKSELEKGLHKRVGTQYPTEFECEMLKMQNYYGSNKHPFEEALIPKTTTNDKGQRVWVGKYK